MYVSKCTLNCYSISLGSSLCLSVTGLSIQFFEKQIISDLCKTQTQMQTNSQLCDLNALIMLFSFQHKMNKLSTCLTVE